MADDRAKTQQEIFQVMHQELRAWNPKIPESPDRLDPILHILLQLYSNELARVDQRVSDLWTRATNSLLRSLNPECRRWPVPAHTVMRCEITDPVAEIDPHTRFIYREEREGGQTFFFSPIKTEKMVNAAVRHIFLSSGDKVLDLSPTEDGSQPTAHGEVDIDAAEAVRLYIGVAYNGNPSDFKMARLFLSGHAHTLKKLRWGYWYPSAASGRFYDDCGFCPGLTSSIEDVVRADDTEDDWGGLRSGASLFEHLDNNFVILPESFATTWERGPVPTELGGLLTPNDIAVPTESDALYWIRIDLPDDGPQLNLTSPTSIFFDSCIVINYNELTLFKHTGGNPLVVIEIPEHLDSILKINTVIDSTGKSYLPRHRLYTDLDAGTYVLEERNDRLALWFDFSTDRNPPPDSITVTYSVTAGTDANAIGVGRIVELYESHPGISGGRNLIPTGGAIPARTERQVVDEAAVRLRSRDRALTFPEISRWAASFDPRIRTVNCDPGIERTQTGVRRCILVRLAIDPDQFCSEDEINLMRTRLASFLRSRAPVNTHFKVETTKG